MLIVLLCNWNMYSLAFPLSWCVLLGDLKSALGQKSCQKTVGSRQGRISGSPAVLKFESCEEEVVDDDDNAIYGEAEIQSLTFSSGEVSNAEGFCLYNTMLFGMFTWESINFWYGLNSYSGISYGYCQFFCTNWIWYLLCFKYLSYFSGIACYSYWNLVAFYTQSASGFGKFEMRKVEIGQNCLSAVSGGLIMYNFVT